VDGRPARIEVANGYARAVAVGSGRHVVRFGYAPSSFRWGAAVSGAALAVSGVVLLLVPAIRRRRRGSTTRGG
jgi:hypothetical protein